MESSKIKVDPESSGWDPIGQVLHDAYRLTRLIGEGGMGSVYEAVHVRLAQKRFAVKLLHPSVAKMTNVYARFRREAEIATKLGHPNIVEVLDFNKTEHGQAYMVMEFLEGEDLSSRLHQMERLPPAEVARIMTQVGSALHCAHHSGIVHRDMKPANIFLVSRPGEEERQAKILDFGISKIRHSTTMLTGDATILGTPSYMSPEQADGLVRDIDQTTDIFALAVICYQILSGKLPFNAPTPSGVLYQVCHAQPDPVSEFVPGLPKEVDPVLFRALAKQKEARYQRVEAFVRDLVTTLEKSPQARSGVFEGLLPRSFRDQQESDSNGAPVSANAPKRKKTIPLGMRDSLPGRLSEEAGPSDTTPDEEAGPGAEIVASLTAADESPPGSKQDTTSPWAAQFYATVISRPARRWVIWGAMALGAAILVGGVAYYGSGWSRDSTAVSLPRSGTVVSTLPSALVADALADASSPSAAARADATPGGAAVRTLITLELNPPHARVLLDGRPRTDNPLVLEPSDRIRRLKVVAHGYVSAEQEIGTATSRNIRIRLKRKPRRISRKSRAVVGAPAAVRASPGPRPDSGNPRPVPGSTKKRPTPKKKPGPPRKPQTPYPTFDDL